MAMRGQRSGKEASGAEGHELNISMASRREEDTPASRCARLLK